MSIYIYIYIYTCMNIYIHLYIHIHVRGKGLPQGRGEAALLHDPLRVAHPSHHGARRVAPSVGFGVWGVRVVFLVLGLGVWVLGFEFWG